MPASPDPAPLLLAPTQAARLLAVSRRTLWRMVRDGRLPPPVRFNRKLVRFKAADVARCAAPAQVIPLAQAVAVNDLASLRVGVRRAIRRLRNPGGVEPAIEALEKVEEALTSAAWAAADLEWAALGLPDPAA